MRKFGLIGYPLSHSFSKRYFTEKFARENIDDCVYELYPIENITELPRLFTEENLSGLNVTIPYKRQVLPYLDNATNAVLEMQACNCILNRDGKLHGHNTDVIGFERTFAPHLQAHHDKALILGTGGAASAVEFTLEKLNINYKLVSRSKSANLRSMTYADLNEQLLSEYKIIINTTPLGTSPDVHNCPAIPYEYITSQHYLYDLVYNPAKTLFLQKGEERGAAIENGAQMLVIQAEESWKIWNEQF
jgi:shikimate dehydrogenase